MATKRIESGLRGTSVEEVMQKVKRFPFREEVRAAIIDDIPIFDNVQKKKCDKL